MVSIPFGPLLIAFNRSNGILYPYVDNNGNTAIVWFIPFLLYTDPNVFNPRPSTIRSNTRLSPHDLPMLKLYYSKAPYSKAEQSCFCF